ncbi:MGH1-like glycoside hydrolase domain-containing protein [Alloacidobacterium sp.]|uniref:MGH1-like glycoside hydrolase domain-containing protein n=1 Tax=Alloacidobacterium sp. TaxID=2951999 RepID=UPI002D699E4F|nr:glucosidase [Alloacidobacterium sp.]HYK37816.1 glucosidase [Alloacidobacterium sp.]
MTSTTGQSPSTLEHPVEKIASVKVPTAIETAEGQRLLATHGKLLWRRWGPYVSERSWGTVREDYSPNGAAWDYLSHDASRSKAYRWGEDGMAAICDRYQLLVFGLALWNNKDPILKERAFGLTPSEGNHGEDVKEYYFYLDSTPTHSYMKYLYKYPQASYPYEWLLEENRKRCGQGYEFELLDTRIFDENRYFDVFVEYGKASAEDICVRIEAVNRGPDAAPLHIIPQLWFRNIWAWTKPRGTPPIIADGPKGEGTISLVADDASAERLKNLPFDYSLGKHYLYTHADGQPLFTDNETNSWRLYAVPSANHYFKDAFHQAIVDGEHETLNPDRTGSKACIHYEYTVPTGGSVVVRLRLTPELLKAPLQDVDQIIVQRRAEADEFYAAIHPPKATEDEKCIQRQAFAGLLWTKQIYLFDVSAWFDGDDPRFPPPGSRSLVRNKHWRHLNSMRVLSMPDKWEYPWFAAWDLAFHTVPFALIDPEFAKEQLFLMLFEQFQHPSGQIPAYEWEFSDLNPPVHAWAVWRVYNMDKGRTGKGDREFLEKCFHKLLINFAWWVNKVDSAGNNVFEGGFLGLDNITVIDRSEKLPGGAVLEQSDATGWMGMYCLNLMRIALELAEENKTYESLALKFFEHYIYIGAAMKNMGGRKYSLWDEDDGFFYDVLRFPDGSFNKFRVRSLVGIVPLYAAETLRLDDIENFQEFKTNFLWFVKNRKQLTDSCCHYIARKKQYELTIVDEDQLRRLLERILSPEEFLSDFGIRSLSKYHGKNPFIFGNSEVCYDPAESNNKIKGGNSNWRGPIWFPTTFLIIESLRTLGAGYGNDFKLSIPDDSDGDRDLFQIAGEIANRMIRIFTRNEDGRRPVYGGTTKFQEDPYWKDLILFYEFYHGDNGAGIGASHQTGWSALVAALIEDWRR